ncbi:hypothetical protein [Dyadobacter bucti]|uniref:hypothetical protein n=1 Tax=Dyadobacter bucti TaxID=2572203 RepID=UPI003F707CFF
MSRIIEFTLQSKGGVGKSFHTYFRALSVPDEHSLFVDVDSSTQTSTRQLKFLGADRLETISLLDNRDVLVRDTFLGYMESLAESSFEKIYMDFGAPESEQIPALIHRDIPFKEFCDELCFEVAFNIVVGGGGAYKASVDYLQKIISILNDEFKVIVWENITSFNQFPSLSTELADNCKRMGLTYKRFGDFEPSTLLGGQVLDGIRKGYSLNSYSAGAKIRIKKELKENFNNG